jgi:hypothetical protein
MKIKLSEGKVTIIFCHGDAWYSKIIEEVDHGYWTHVAGIMFNSILESQGTCDKIDRYPGVWLHNPNKYINDNITAKFIDVELEDIEAAEDKARELIGCPYSFHGCIEAGLMELFNLQPPIDGEKTVMCAELWDTILKSGRPKNITLPPYKPDFVAPMRLYNSIIGK